MPRRRWRDSFKSFLGSYIDPEKIEELRGNKAEFDGKVQRILRSLKEDGNDRKETVADLIENFNSHYQSLYARYDYLIEKLRKKAQGKHGKDSSSSSSDSSDSDDSPTIKGENDSLVENKFENDTAVVKQELETALSEVDELKRKLTATLDEKEALYLEYQSALSKSEEAERIISELRTEGEKWNEEKSKLLIENSNLNSEFIKLSEEHKQLEIRFHNREESLKDVDAKTQEISRLEENVEDLKMELEMKADEISTLMDNMRTTEVNQRLTSRKLHVTEQVLIEKEEIHQRRIEKFLEEQKSFEERIATLTGIIATYKEAQVKIVKEMSEKVNYTLAGFDSLSVKFDEDYGHLESRIYEVANELKVAMNLIRVNNIEKDRLKKESASLVQQLNNEKEQELGLTVKIGELETKLRHDEDERKSLVESVKQQEEKMEELEKKMKEKDDEILRLGEEKVEAIRQLCVWIDHHQSRYDALKDAISKTRG